MKEVTQDERKNERAREIGLSIRRARETRNLSQEALAEKLDVSRQAVGKWENGASLPRGRHKAKLEAALGLRLQTEPEPAISARRMRLASGGWILALCLLIALCFMIAARPGGSRQAAPSAAEYMDEPLHKYVFPNGADLVTEYNREILDRERMSLTLALPAGWTARSGAQGSYPYGVSGLFSLEYLFDPDEVCVGAIGFNLLPPDAGSEEKLPMELFHAIALGNDWRFAVREDYALVARSGHGETALTHVSRSGVLSGGAQGTETVAPGILFHDTQAGVFVAVELSAGVLTDEEVLHIAESMTLQ